MLISKRIINNNLKKKIIHLKFKSNLMSKTKLGDIWLDGYKPTANLRSKTKIVEKFGEIK